MKRFNDFYRRVLAYAFDFLLIQLFVSVLVDSNVINFQYNNYAKTYKEYEALYNDYDTYKDINIKDCEDLSNKIEKKEIDIEDITIAYSEIADEDECNALVDTINSRKMSEKDFVTKRDKMYYKLQRLSTFRYVVTIVVTALYLILFQGFTNGKTLGKKIMHLRVKPINKKKYVSYKQLAIRSIFLGNLIYYILSSILPWVLSQSIYINITDGLYGLNILFTIFMVVFAYANKEMRGPHDILANTEVIIDLKEKK